jgi:hypothetical protein
MTIIIDGTVGANKAVVLDSAGKLPAIDGSLVTTLNATQVTTGTIATANIDTGTTTGKVLVLDGSGAMPAIAAGAMTGVSSATKSASDPTVSTNPSTGLGTKWINTTSGEIFILTDATAGSNVWISTGGTSGNVASYYYGGTNSGYVAGGAPGSGVSSYIHKYSLSSDGGSVSHGDLATGKNYLGQTNASPHATGYCYVLGGYIPSGNSYTNQIEKFAISSNTTATVSGNLSVGRAQTTGSNSDTHGFAAGGTTAGPMVNTVDKFLFATDSDATDHGDLTGTKRGCASHSYGITYGFTSASENPAGSQIDRYAFASNTTATDFGDLSGNRAHGSGASDEDYGYTAGGSNVNYIERFAFASLGNSTDVGDLTTGRQMGSSASSITHGYLAGGVTVSPSDNYSDDMQKYQFAASANATDVGNLSSGINAGGGNHS